MATAPEGVRVLVIARDPLARAGLAALLAQQPGCTVVGQVSDEGHLDDDIQTYQPDVLLWDMGWDPSSAVERLMELPEDHVPVVALLADALHAREVWQAGVGGLLHREAETAEIAAALPAVAQGLLVLAPEFASALATSQEPPGGPLAGELTARELQVLQLLAEGLPNKQIARRLGISEHTVKFHVNAVLSKLGAQSRTEAVVRATRMGLILL